MAAANDARSPEPNIQDVFLNHVRREKVSVIIRMMDGAELQGRIKSFDRFSVVLDHAGSEHMIFKHAIAVITTTPRGSANDHGVQAG